ncbi:hypothetical protein ERJ75_001032100 [Trypanosoma vivax]|nr:hypothetical protein ERJ75_001032100 [Trypanosoma vivax]
MGNIYCIAACLFALAAAACEAAAPKGLKTAEGKGLCKYAGALRFAGKYAASLAQEAERRAATARHVKELASLAQSLAEPIDGKNTSDVAEGTKVEQSKAETVERELEVRAVMAGRAARALTFASGSLRSFVEVLAAMGTGANVAQARSCINGDKQLKGSAIGPNANANTMLKEACEEVDNQRGKTGKDLNETEIAEQLKGLEGGVELVQQVPASGGEVTPAAGSAECRLLAIAGKDTPGDGGLLLTTDGNAGEAQNTVHLGTFVKITALTGGSASFNKTRELGEGMTVDDALQALTATKTALERHKAFACSEKGCPKLDEAKQTLRRTVSAIQNAKERAKSEQKEARSAHGRTETQMKARTDSASAETGLQEQAHTENAQTGYTASDASQGVPFAATLAVAASAATTHFVPQQGARH